MTCEWASPWIFTCYLQVISNRGKKRLFGPRPREVGQSHTNAEGKGHSNSRKVTKALLSHPSLPPPPPFAQSPLSSDSGCVSLRCGWGRRRKTEDIKRHAYTSDPQEGHLNELRWGNSAQNSMLGDTVGMSKRGTCSPLVVGRSGWSINGKFLLVKNWSQFLSDLFLTLFRTPSACKNPNQESPDISM